MTDQLNPARLRRVGVECFDENHGFLRCLSCGGTWQPQYRSGGGYGRRYWICPHHRCNAGYRNIARPHPLVNGKKP